MLQADLNWDFKDQRLFAAACSGDGPEFQRLEFLGDAIADAVLVRWIHQWSTGTVAVLSGARQQLTSDATLGRLALLTGLHEVLTPALRAVPERTGDLIEAIVGAAFLDGGWVAATRVCEAVFSPWLSEPQGATARAARIDTVVVRRNSKWRWTYRLWTDQSPRPITKSGATGDLVSGEIEALTVALEQLDRAVPSVWVEMSSDLQAVMADDRHNDYTPAVQTLRAMLAQYDGVWIVPSDRIDTTLRLWGRDPGEPDGVLSGFEHLIGHDFAANSLERLALTPGPEQRRLAFVGGTILKSAAAIQAFTTQPQGNEGNLTNTVTDTIALARLNRIALSRGLPELLMPGERPADPIQIVKAALGALAIDAGAEQATQLATEWISKVRVSGASVNALCSIYGHYARTATDAPLVAHIELSTQRNTSAWEFNDQTVTPMIRMIEGICTAIDSLTAADAACPIVIAAPPRLVEAFEDPAGVNPQTKQALSRLMSRLDERGIKAVWGSQPTQPTASAHRRTPKPNLALLQTSTNPTKELR